MADKQDSAENRQPTLREQSGAVVSDVRAAVLHSAQHLEALGELLRLELREYGRRQVRRVVTGALGVALLLCAYITGCFCVVVELQPLVGLRVAFLAVIIFNAVVGGVLLLAAALRKPASLAPTTCEEIKKDIECVKIYLKGNEKS